MAARKYQMTRIGAGDYVIPSNDATVLWRIYAYDEDGSASTSDDGKTWKPLLGRFWASARYRRPLPTDGALPIPDDFLEWENWETAATGFTRRADALEDAFRERRDGT